MYTMVTGQKEHKQDMETTIGLMEMCITENGQKEKEMDKVLCMIKMVLNSIMVHGKMMNLMTDQIILGN